MSETLKVKAGTLRVVPTDMREIRDKVKTWEEANPAPAIPKIPITPAHFKLKEQRMAIEMQKREGISIELAEKRTAEQLGEMDNPKDPEYQAALNLWKTKRYIHMETMMVSGSVLIGTKVLRDWDEEGKLSEAAAHPDFLILGKVLRDNEPEGDRVKLYRFIHSVSELTWEAVVEAAEEFGARRFGKNILTMIPKGGSEPQTLISMGCSAARESNVPTAEYLRLAVKSQAVILAVWLSDKWREHFAYEEAKAKAGR